MKVGADAFAAAAPAGEAPPAVIRPTAITMHVETALRTRPRMRQLLPICRNLSPFGVPADATPAPVTTSAAAPHPPRAWPCASSLPATAPCPPYLVLRRHLAAFLALRASGDRASGSRRRRRARQGGVPTPGGARRSRPTRSREGAAPADRAAIGHPGSG